MDEYPKIFAQLPEIPECVESASDAYSVAFELARAGDVLGWRQLMKRIKPSVLKALVKWRERELDGQEPDFEKLFQIVDGGVNVISPLISVALMGVESCKEELKDQKSLIYDLMNIPGWNRTSNTTWSNIPDVLGYVYHSLHGGLSLLTGQLDLALDLARTKIPVADASKHLYLWQRSELRGYAESISGNSGGNCVKGWKYLAGAYERPGWEWLSHIFGDEFEYRASLVAYYLALHIHELAANIASGNEESLPSNFNPYLEIPLTFVSEGTEVNQRAISLLIQKPQSLPMLWSVLNVERAQMEHAWRDWIRTSEIWLRSAYGAWFHTEITHQHLFDLI